MLQSDQLSKLRDDGYVILRDFFPAEMMRAVEIGLGTVLAMQAGKLGHPDYARLSHQDRATGGQSERGRLDEVVTWLDERDAEALDQGLVMATSTLPFRRLASHANLGKVCSTLLGVPEDLLLFSGPSVLVNLPTVDRRLYTWHSEANWYPKRRSFLNLWIPFVRNKNETNGTMHFKRATHSRDWPFAEYYGHSKTTQGDKRYFLQYEIPEQELREHADVAVVASVGDLVVFDRRLVHRSSMNTDPLPSYALTIRPYDYRRDLTISANWGERPYRDTAAPANGGRSGLVPVG